jgi:hypothetical protein
MKTKITRSSNPVNYYFLPLPDRVLESLGWEEHDEVAIETTLDCYPSGEITSIILINLTKNKEVETFLTTT